MVESFVLPNGVTCICEERPQTGKVAMQVYINQGAASEKPEEQGLTNLAQEACFAGTTSRSREEINQEVESKGGVIGSETRLTTSSFMAVALSRYAEDTFAVLSDVVRNPSFPPHEVDWMRAQLKQGIAEKQQDAGKKMNEKFMETAFAGQGLGADPVGTPELIDSFTPAQLQARHAELLSHPSSIVVSFAGDIDAKTARKLAEKYFGDLVAADPAPQIKATFTAGEYREANQNDQLNLMLGFPAPSSSDSNRYATMMFQNLLAGGMSRPLFQELREKRSLVYTPFAEYVPMPSTGVFLIATGTGKGKAGELLDVTFDLLGKIAREGFTDKEIDEARERILRANAAAREKSHNACTANAMQMAERGRVIPPEEFEARLKEVTNDDVRRYVAGMLQQGKYVLSAVGPQDTLPPHADIEAMMKRAGDGVDVPPRKLSAEQVKADFTIAATAANRPAEAPEPKITVLDNGLTIITVERQGQLSCGAWVGVGSDNETEHLNGATHMNEHMMFKGTPHYPPGEIDSIVNGELGGQLNAYTAKDKTCYYFFNLEPSALEKVLDICGQMVFFANIDEGEYAGRGPKNGKPAIKGEREAVHEEINMCNDELGDRLMEQLDRLCYGSDQPHGRPILGTPEGLMNISAQELRNYRDEFYVPNNVIICAAGPVKHEDVVAAVKKMYGNLKPGTTAKLAEPEWRGGTEAEEMKTATLCTVATAANAVSMTHPDYLAYVVLSTLMGDGDTSYLNREIVDKQHLAPGVNCGMQGHRNCGQFVMASSVEAEKVKPLVAAMYASLRDLSGDLTEETLAKGKAALEMTMLSNLETNGSASNQYAIQAQAHGRLVLPSEVSAALEKLTVDDIKRVARNVLASNPAASMIVPPGTDPSLLPTQAEVIAMRDGTYVPPAAMPKPQGPGVSPSTP